MKTFEEIKEQVIIDAEQFAEEIVYYTIKQGYSNIKFYENMVDNILYKNMFDSIVLEKLNSFDQIIVENKGDSAIVRLK